MKKLDKMFFLAAMLLLSLLFVPSNALAQIRWQENFDYPVGGLYGSGGWGRYGSNPNDPIQVVDQRLDYAGYPGGVKGKSVILGPATSGEDLLVRFDPSENGVKTGTVYYSALINVSTPSTGSIYVMSLLPRTKNSVVADKTSPTELGRLFIAPGDNDGEYKMGVDRGAQKPVFADAAYKVGTTYLIVVKYEIGVQGPAKDAVSLFVNPSSFDAEPAAADVAIDPEASGSGVSNYGLQGFELRQGSTSKITAPTMTVGSLRISDTYKGLFSAEENPGETTPKITLSEKTLDFGTLYSGDKAVKTVNVKAANLTGDITVSVTGTELTASRTIIAADEAQSDDGADVEFTLNPTSGGGYHGDILF